MKRSGWRSPTYVRPKPTVRGETLHSADVHAPDDPSEFPPRPLSCGAINRGPPTPAPKSPRVERDPAYLAYVRTRACLGCGKPGPNHAHHAHGEPGLSKGMGTKASDWTCVPLCHDCHGRWHARHELTPGLGRPASIRKMATARARLRRAWASIQRDKL